MDIDERISELRAEIEVINKQISDKYAEIGEIEREKGIRVAALASALREKYGSFIGRAVQVSGESIYGGNITTEGVLASEAFITCCGDVIPFLYKIKKNGAVSKYRVPDWDLPRVNESFTIKLR